MEIDLKNLTIQKAHEAMKKGEFTARELAQNYLDIIAEKNPELNAYLYIFDDVLEQADEADKRFKDKTAEILTGIPIAIKNNICIKDKPTTAGSKILENYKATYDATVIEKLKQAGVIFLGGTNLDEFGMGSSTENSAFGVTKNPYDDTRVAGGSSGGSTVVIAADMALVSLGTDTGGSIRQPASFCGVVGLKTTYGRVSRHGAVAFGSSLDQIGPIAKNIDDTKIVYDYIKGEDENDSTTLFENLVQEKQSEIKERLKIGVPRHFMKDGVDKDVMKNFEESLEKMESLGYEIVDIELPNIKYSLPAYYVIMPAEASSNLARFDGVKYGLYKEGENLLEDYTKTRGEGFGKETRRRVLLGTYVLSAGYYDAYYNKANSLRDVIRSDFSESFKKVDIIMTPTTSAPAFKIGEKSNNPLKMYLEDIFTVSANITGVPAISVPSGFVNREDKELPVGLQIIAPHMREDLLFKSGKDFFGE
ncbi:Asp-tRNA(Asn)/Glu-tRNA(Gln) amidotransferase subunit GatA [Patescibacteria group bacterium]